MNFVWNYTPPSEDRIRAAKELAEKIGMSPILADLLIQRGIKTESAAKRFFRPMLSELIDPFLMNDMDVAVDRLNDAMGRKEPILVYGDYDVDGCTAVALVYKFLLQFYSNIDYYIPDRYEEGYGISKKGIDFAAATGVRLIIVLDCGIKAVEEIAYAKSLGVDFIICDHHVPDSELPEAVAILNPKRTDNRYPDTNLSGCGVGFKLMQAFAQSNGIAQGRLVPLLDLCVVSIASDIVPITGENRMIVSNIAGTTRDATDTAVENKFGKFVFIDTAGLRRKSRVDDAIEKYSVIRARMAVERAQVCVIMIDATEGFTEQDSKVAGIAHEQGKACIIAVNKWDAVEKDGKTMDEYRKKLMQDFSFMSYAPIIFISAKTGQRLDRLFELIKFVDEQNAMRIKTGRLNEILAAATTRVQPPTDKGRRLKIYYMTQASTRPPTFVCFVNRKDLFHYSYQRYLENQFRKSFGFEGTPIRFILRQKSQKEE